MSRKILVAQALGEARLLEKKIREKCNTENLDMDEAENENKQIMNWIRQLRKIHAVILQHNATTEITTSIGTVLLESAIGFCDSFRKEQEDIFEILLRDKLQKEYDSIMEVLPLQNMRVPHFAKMFEEKVMKLAGEEEKDDKLKEISELYKKAHTQIIVDPLNVLKVIAELEEKTTRLYEELSLQIQISNATSYIEID